MNGAQVSFQTEPTGPDAPTTAVERPAHVPEKFWDAEKGAVKTEDLLKSYTSLETKLGVPKDTPVTTEEKPEGQTEEETPKVEDKPKDEGERIAEEQGLDMEALGQHWLEHGKLDDETYEKLAKVGITKEEADSYAAFKLNQATEARTAMFEPYGGDEGVAKMTEWASKNWTEAQAAAFNKAAESGDRGQIEIALKGLKADFDKANGVRPKLVTPTSAAAVAGDKFESLPQFLAAQRDPRYATDPAYRESVIAKLARSNI